MRFAVYAAIGISPDMWWRLAGAGWLVAGAAQASLASAMLARRTRPLERPALRARLEALTRRVGAPSIAIHEWRVGPTSDAANAAVVGIGPSRRILVSDTLLDDYSDEEIEVIIAHEIGHHVHWDMWQAIFSAAAVALAAFWTADAVLSAAPLSLLGVEGLWDVGSVPLLALGVRGGLDRRGPDGQPAVALAGAQSRPLRVARDGQSRGVRGPDSAGVSAQYLAEERPPRLVEWFFHSHPSLAARMAGARAAASKS